MREQHQWSTRVCVTYSCNIWHFNSAQRGYAPFRLCVIVYAKWLVQYSAVPAALGLAFVSKVPQLQILACMTRWYAAYVDTSYQFVFTVRVYSKLLWCPLPEVVPASRFKAVSRRPIDVLKECQSGACKHVCSKHQWLIVPEIT